MQQGQNAGIGQGESQSNRPGDGKGHYGDDQQASQVRPAFPLTSGLEINGLSTVFCGTKVPERFFTLPALTLTAVNL